jgi:hypothetical protein
VIGGAGSVGPLRLDEARIAITGLDAKDEVADIQIVARGQVRDQLQLIDSPRLGFMKNVGMNPGDFGGEGVTRVRFGFPLVNDLRMDQVAVVGTAEAKGFALKRAALGQDARDGEMTVKFDEKGLNAVGKLTVGRTPTEVDYTLGFQSSNPVRERIKASGRLPAGELAQLGFDFFQPYLEGPVPLSLDFTSRRNGAAELAIEAGLEATKLTLADIGWEKAAGQPGSGKFDLLIQRDRVVEIRNIRVSAGDADIVGRLRMAPDGKSIARIDLDRARVGRTNLRINAAREPRAWRVQVSGSALDLAEIKLDGPDAPGAPSRPRLAVEANIQRVWVTREQAVTQRRIPRRTRRAVGTRAGQRVGHRSRWQERSVHPRPHDRRRRPPERARPYRQRRGDAAQPGRHRQDRRRRDGAHGRDRRECRRKAPGARRQHAAYRMVDEPAIARFLATALITGIPDSMRGEGIGFDRLQAKARLHDSVLEIQDMRTSGPALGIQARGKIEIGADRIEMEGTIVPANAVNSLFGRIPVIGEILFGPGLFAARYTVRGPRANPEVTINPLSALAPGVLRNIFGIFDGGGAPQQGQAPQDAPAGDNSP